METKLFTLAPLPRLSDVEIISAIKNCLPQLTNRRVVIVAPDHTRPFNKFEHYLLEIAQELYGRDNVDLAIATGMHRQSTWTEVAQKWGNGIRHCEIFQNNPSSPHGLMDRLRDENYFIIAYSNPLPHNHMGMSGGLKLLLPGLAHIEDANLFHCMNTDAAKQWQNKLASCVDFWIGCAYDSFHYVIDYCFAERKHYFDSWVDACKRYYKIQLPIEMPDAVLLEPTVKNADFILAMNSLLVAKKEPIVKHGGVVAIHAPLVDGAGVHYLFQKMNGQDDIFYDYIFSQEMRNCEFHFINDRVPQRALQRFFKNRYVVMHKDEDSFFHCMDCLFEGSATIHHYIAPEIMIGERDG